MDNSKCRILLISGSLREGSTNGAILSTAATLAPPGATVQIYRGMGELPHFNPDDDREPLPLAPAQLRAQLRESDAVLFSTPEYAGTLPGSFKNLLDWTVGEGLYEKPVGFINAASVGAGQGALATLRVVLGYITADPVEGACLQLPVRRDAYGSDGIIRDPQLRSAIAAALVAIADHVTAKRANAALVQR